MRTSPSIMLISIINHLWEILKPVIWNMETPAQYSATRLTLPDG